MFARKRAARAYWKSFWLGAAFELVLCFLAAELAKGADGNALFLAGAFWVGLQAAQVALALKAAASALLYYWFVGRKDAVDQLVETFRLYKLPAPDLNEESVESWLSKVAGRGDLGLEEKTDVLLLYAATKSPLASITARAFLSWSLERAAEKYALAAPSH